MGSIPDHALDVGKVYDGASDAPYSRVKYLGLDRFWGETTHKFKTLDPIHPNGTIYCHLGELDTIVSLPQIGKDHASVWREITRKVKDGRQVDIWARKRNSPTEGQRFVNAKFLRGLGIWLVGDAERELSADFWEVTHWMPLPPEPPL